MKPLAERVKSGQFLYMTELVASGLKREAQVSRSPRSWR